LSGPPRLYSDEERKERHRIAARECNRRKRAAIVASSELHEEAKSKERARSKQRREFAPGQVREAYRAQYQTKADCVIPC
jgi:hypothetical protein